MNILKKILAVIGILAALMCALILLCALNPGITEKLSRLVSHEGGRPRAEEELPDAGEEQELPLTEEGQEDPIWEQEEELPEQQEEPAVQDSSGQSSFGEMPDTRPDRNVVRGTNGYEAPSEYDISVPEAVSGKSGFQPITEKSEELPDTEDGEYISELGYGELGDGLSFDPVFYPYYHMLDDKGQHLYRQIFANANVSNSAFAPIEAVSVPEIRNVIMAVYNDHPELFWLNTAFVCKYDKNKICAELELEFNITQEELPEASTEFYNTVNNLLTQVQNLDTYGKERQLHDILLEKIEYDKGADMNQSAYSALVNGESVCAGYARAYQYLLQRLGIPCYYCTGYAGEDHAWNIVALDDGYYNVDVTWDDTPEGEHDFFNKTDEDYAETHVRRDLSVNLPKCEGERYRDL